MCLCVFRSFNSLGTRRLIVKYCAYFCDSRDADKKRMSQTKMQSVGANVLFTLFGWLRRLEAKQTNSRFLKFY